MTMDMESWEKIGRLAGWIKSSSINGYKLTTRISGWKLDRYPMLTFEGTVTFMFTDGHRDSRDDRGGIEIDGVEPVDLYAVKNRGKFKIRVGHECWRELEHDLMYNAYSHVLLDAMWAKADMDRREMKAWKEFEHNYDEESGEFYMDADQWEKYESMFGEDDDEDEDEDYKGPKDPRFPDL